MLASGLMACGPNCYDDGPLENAFNQGVHAAQAENRAHFDRGYADGQSLSYDDGVREGEEQGYPEGYWAGWYSPGAYAAGFELGYVDGHSVGYSDPEACAAGAREGWVAGENAGWFVGWDEAYEQGWGEGWDEGWLAGADACALRAESGGADPKELELCETRGYERSVDPGAYSQGLVRGKQDNEDYMAGYRPAYDEAFARGWSAGLTEGHAAGVADGHASGYVDGWDAAYFSCFDQAYVGAKCVPSRATQLTGRFQYAINLPSVDGKLGANHWFKDLRANGYYTGFAGKWHWGKGTEAHGHGISWDESTVWDRGQYDAAGGWYYDQLVMINGGEMEPLGGYATDRYNEIAVDFIRARAQQPEQPWFFWLAYTAVHSPYTPAERHLQRYLDAEPVPLPADIFGPRPDKPSHMQESEWAYDAEGELRLHGKETRDFLIKQQMQAVAAVDEGVGMFLAALAETGQLDNTIIIFTADQGYVWGEHGIKGKIWPYAAAIKSPLLISNPPRFPQGAVCSAPVNGPDLVRTFHALTGTEPKGVLHGRDMTRLLEQPESASVISAWNETPTMMCYLRNRYDAAGIAERLRSEHWDNFRWRPGSEDLPNNAIDPKAQPTWFSLHDGRYKYIRYCYPNKIEELYDVLTDPDELTNLAVDESHANMLQAFRAELITQLKAYDGGDFAELLPEPVQR